MPRTPFRRQIVADYIQQIEQGRLKPLQELPYYAVIAAAYGCSLQPVKAAMDELEVRGYVVTHQGKRASVAANPPNVRPETA